MQNKKTFASILFISVSLIAMPQSRELPPPGPSMTPPPPPGFPIDSGIFVLFLLALVYGIYKTYLYTKKTT